MLEDQPKERPCQSVVTFAKLRLCKASQVMQRLQIPRNRGFNPCTKDQEVNARWPDGGTDTTVVISFSILPFDTRIRFLCARTFRQRYGARMEGRRLLERESDSTSPQIRDGILFACGKRASRPNIKARHSSSNDSRTLTLCMLVPLSLHRSRKSGLRVNTI